ncbi:MAG: tyrosine-type recombinase/integrase [Candidatus Limnocylindrales bacterium]
MKRDAAAGALPTGATTAEYLTVWLDRTRTQLRASSWHRRGQVVRTHLVPALGRTPLAKLTPADVERMTTAIIASGRSPRTAVLARVILRRALGDALRDGMVARNVAALARPPRVPISDLQAGRDYLDTPDLRRLLAAAADHPLGPLVILAATTGLRQGELLGLSWDDVRLDGAPSLTVRRSLAQSFDGGYALAEPKTARSRRTINLPAVAAEALARQRDLQEAARKGVGSAWQGDRDRLVFTDAVGRPLLRYNVTRGFHGLLTAAGLPSVPFHALRHSVATALLAAGVPLRVVADLLGHSTITITANTYAAVVPELRRDAADAMDRALGSSG